MSGEAITRRRGGAESDTWPRVRLGEVCVSLTSQIRQRDLDGNTGPYPIFGAAGILRNSCFCMVDKPAIAMVKDGAGVGRVMCIPANSAVIGTMLILKPNNGIDRGYLFYALSSLNLGRLCSGATIPHLYFRDIKALTVPLPPLAIQRRIAAKLDLLCDIVAKRKGQLSQLNQLVKSRFVEMFGDPLTNLMGWPMAKIGDHLEFLTSGSRGWAKYYSDNGELFITIKNVKGGKISVDDVQHVKPPTGAETERTRVHEGDLLISITADLGRTGVVSWKLANRGAYINQHLSCIRLDRKRVEPLFLAFYLESAAGKAQFEKKNQSAVKAGLNFEAIRSLRFYLPPLALQREFAAFVEKVDKLAAAVKRGLEAAERLYRQQMQEFLGEAATKTTKTTETTKTTKTANAGGFSLGGLSTPSQGLNSPVGHRAKGGNANG